MPKFNISKSIHVKASPEKVFNTLNDFNAWVEWSPWLIMDRETKVDIAADNKSYVWNGKRTGSGNMSILSEKPYKEIHFDLNFLKPWKSNSKVSFEVEEKGTETLVTWNMASSLPFFMFFMKKMMVAFVGNDYERGLKLLKDYVEDGEIHSQLNFLGENKYRGHSYIGIKRSCSMNESAIKMQEDIEQVTSFGNFEDIFVQYHKWDFVKKVCIYTAAIGVDEVPEDLPSNFVSGIIPYTKVYILEHVGPYKHLGNAWTTVHNMQRSKEFKVRKDIHPFETYANNPNETAPNDLVTHIHFPIK